MPYIVLSMLPQNAPGLDFARDRYGYDTFDTEDAAYVHLEKIAAGLRAAGLRPEDFEMRNYEAA